MRPIMKRVRWIALGAGLAWFLDPARGSARRARVREQLASTVRRAGRAVGQQSPGTAEQLEGVAGRIDDGNEPRSVAPDGFGTAAQAAVVK